MSSPIAHALIDEKQRLEAVYPSIGCTSIGRWLGKLYECLPHITPRIRMSYLLFIPPTLPVAVLAYVWLKVRGVRYVATTSGLAIETVLMGQVVKQIAWSEVREITVDQSTFEPFYRSSDIAIQSNSPSDSIRLSAVPFADRFCQLLQDARQATQATVRAQEQISDRARTRQLAAAIPPQ